MKISQCSGLDENGPSRLLNKMKLCDKGALLDLFIQFKLECPIMAGHILERLGACYLLHFKADGLHSPKVALMV